MCCTLLDGQSVFEGGDLQHVEECSLRSSHLVSSFDQLDVVLKDKKWYLPIGTSDAVFNKHFMVYWYTNMASQNESQY